MNNQPKRVTADEAKITLDRLLLVLTKRQVAKLSGVSHVTITRIDNLSCKSVEKSIVDIFDRMSKCGDGRK